MEVCANYLHESDTEREWELLSSANMLPHLLTCITRATGFLLVNALQHWAALIVLWLQSDMLDGLSALIRHHSRLPSLFTCLHAFSWI